MIKKFQLLFSFTFACLAAYAANGDVFKANSPEGVEITFKVISEADKTCQVGTGEYSDATISKSYAGPLTIPATANGYKVTTIASWSFYYYPNLTGITISEGVEQLMSNSIEQCGNITDFVIPTSVTSLSSSFGGVGAGLKSISVAEGNAIYDSRENCNAIIETSTNTLVCGCNTTTLPSSITSIGAWSMTYYDHESITIPEKITSIGDGAFRGSSFKEISIPANIKKIGWDAFSDCSKLEKVTILAQECNIGYGAFCYNYSLKEMVCHVLQPQAASSSIITNSDDGISDDFKLYVPFGTKTLYEQTEGWNNVKNVVEFNVAGSSSLSIEDFKMIAGKAKAMSLDVVNPAQAVTSVEFDLTLPEGLTIVTNDGKPDVEIVGRTTAENHSLEATVNGGNVHIKVYSTDKNVISGTDGALLRFNLTAGNSFTGGNVTLSHQVLTSPDGTKSEPEDLMYAVTADEEVIINFADENVKAICVEKWDTDGDGELSTAEAAAVTSLSEVFAYKHSISTFDELKYFTGLTSIGFNAFHMSGIKSVTLPPTITEIGGCAFSESFLESITLPDGLTSIGYEAFTDCCLTSIVIPASVTMFGTNAFQYCGLKEVTSLITDPKSIGEDVFTCYSTAVLKVPEGTRVAYRNAKGWNKFMYTAEPREELFFETDGITYGKIYDEYGNASVCLKDGKSASGDYRIPSSVECEEDGRSYNVTVIGDGAFAGSALTSLCLYDDEAYYYNNNVKTFGDGVFRNCASLKTVTFSPYVTSIGYNLFEGCNALEWVMSMVKQPAAVTWGEYAFYGWPGYTLYVPFGTTELYKEAGWAPMDNNIIVEGHDSEKFTAENADGVEMTFQVIRAAEKTCKVVKKFVDDDTFVSEAPESVTLPAEVKGFKVTAIDYEAFQFSSVKNVIIPEGVTRIGPFAFAESHLTSITIPKSMTEISSAFRDCKELTTVNISDLAAWCNIKFTGSNGLGHLYLNGEEVKDIVIPEGVTSLGENMALSSPFVGCTSLTSVIIPASVTKMYQPFSGCSNLKSIVVDEGNTVYDSRNNCNAIIETETGKLIAGCNNTIIPEGTTYIADQVFSGCTGLSSTVIPEGVTSIGLGAFLGCSNMTSLVIPSSVTYIGILTFDGCTSLTSVTAFAEEPLTIYSGFPNAANATLYVPKGSKAAYEAANYWKEFKEIAEIEDENPDLKDGDTFTALTPEGVEMTFKVISAYGKTCQVGTGSIEGPRAIDKTYKGPITIPATANGFKVTGIGNFAFYDTQITSATISEGVENIGRGAFRCYFYLKTLELPSTIKSIGEQIIAYYLDIDMGEVYHNNVVSIVSHATEPIDIPDNAFGFDTKYSDEEDDPELFCRAATRGMGDDDFDDDFDDYVNGLNKIRATLYVPAGTLSKYKTIKGWTMFKEMKESLQGDANTDGKVGEEDVKLVEEYIMTGKAEGLIFTNADTNGNRQLNAADIVKMINIIKSKKSTDGMGDIDPEAVPHVEPDVETDDADDI